MIGLETYTTKYIKRQGGETNLRLKHILVTLLMGFVIVFAAPIFALAEEIDQFEDKLSTNEKTDSTEQLEGIGDSATENADAEIENKHNSDDGAIDNEDMIVEDTNVPNDIEQKEINHDELISSENNENDKSDTSTDSSEISSLEHIKDSALIQNENSKTYLSNGLKKGDSNSKVKELKEKLALLGFKVSNNPNNNFGPSTEQKVKEFQKYYGLKDSGIANQETLNKIDKILASPFRNGQSHESIIQLKKDLERLGFKVSNNPNTKYGPSTTRKVEEFQSFYSLVVNGIADEVTLKKINNLLNTPMKRGDYRKDAIYLKERLAKLGFVVSANPTPAYGPSTEKVVKEFQKYYGLNQSGTADSATMNKIDNLLKHSMQRGSKNNDVQKVKNDLAELGFVVSANPNTVFGPSTEKTVKEFQRYYKLRATGIVEERTLAKIKEILNSPFKNGQSHESVIQLKKDLEKLGFKVSNNPNTKYGPSTTKKVEEFQSFYGLVVNGIADEITLAKMQELFNTPMKRGDYRQDAIYLKERLAELGFVVSANPTPAYGPSTEKMVKEFQKYYGLNQSGTADSATMDKIGYLLTHALKRGISNNDVQEMKENLAKLGFAVSANPNTVFGPSTERTVKEFQKYYKLRVTGVVEEKTLAKIKEILTSPYRSGGSHDSVIGLKKDLERLGFKVSDNPNQNYGPSTERKVKELQQYYGLKVNGIADPITLAKINDILTNAMQRGTKDKDVIKLKENLTRLGYGSFALNNTSYGLQTEKAVKAFQKTNNLIVNGIVDDVTLALINKLRPNTIKIFIDAGHGGSDPGAGSGGLKEKDLTLEIAKVIQKYLKQYKNVEIMMSRSSDTTLSLQQRTKMANDWGADYFLSVHINAGGGNGIESYVHNKNATKDAINKQSIIHDHLLNGLKNDNIRDRGKKKANFHVVRETKMSAILIEYLFIDNKTDQEKLKNKSLKNKLGKLTAEGIAKAFGLLK